MILLTTPRGIIEFAHMEPDDENSINGLCGHGVDLFCPCLDCITERQFEPVCRKVLAFAGLLRQN